MPKKIKVQKKSKATAEADCLLNYLTNFSFWRVLQSNLLSKTIRFLELLKSAESFLLTDTVNW